MFIMALSVNRFSHGPLKSPILEPQVKSIYMNAQSQTPVPQAEGFIIPSNEPIIALISALCFLRFPFTVTRFIVPFIVDSFDGIFTTSGTLTHISKEVFKLPPSLANRDSAPTIVLEHFTVGIQASLDYLFPNAIFRPIRSAMPNSKTTARQRASVFYVTSSTCALLPALAKALKSGIARFNYSQNGQTPKRFTNHHIIATYVFVRMVFSQVVHLRNRLNYAVRPVESFSRLFGLIYCTTTEGLA